ncbi:MAG: hypothetical protein ACE37H_12785 [Phycisphaeraceae bacterium]
MKRPATTLALAMLGTTSHAALVQITQFGNAVTPFADNLDPDLTGDGVPELTITATSFFSGGIYQADTTIDGQSYLAIGGTTAGGNVATVTGITYVEAPVGGVAASGHLFNIVFSDPAYGLVDEDGIVEIYIRAQDTDQASSGVFIRRVIFDPDQRGTPGFNENLSYPEAQPIPEPTTAALLAVAGPLTARRRRA